MERSDRTDNLILLTDDYSRESKLLHESLTAAGLDIKAITIDGDGFLPDGVCSIYDIAVGMDESDPTGRPLYFNEVTVPDYWEISSDNRVGKVHEYNVQRAAIYYAFPRHKRFVRIVEWKDASGFVRLSEHYDKHGNLFAKTAFNSKGQKVNRTWFSKDGIETVNENYVTGSVIYTRDGKDHVFRDKTGFITYVLKEAGFGESIFYINSLSYPLFASLRLKREKKKDILFWQEGIRNEIPGNMSLILKGESSDIKKIVVQDKDAYDRFISLGADSSIMSCLGYIYPFAWENRLEKKALICTNSDQILHIEDLVKALPEVHFYIAAITEMSSKLLSLEEYDNVSLYPGIKDSTLEKLLDECDIYLDINRYDEISDIVFRAFIQNMVIFAFKETLHNASFVADSNMYTADEWESVAEQIKLCLGDRMHMDSLIAKQHERALSETKDRYTNL